MEIFEGSLGSGKSYCAVEEGIKILLKGGVLACNFPLKKDWSLTLAGTSISVKLGKKNKVELAKSLHSRCFRIGSVQSVMDVSLLLGDLCIDKMKDKKEGKGIILWDEASLYFNSRSWKDNFEYIKFFINARKLGWEVILITHSVSDLDKQIIPKVEYSSSFRNAQKIAFPFFQIPIWPKPLFIRRKVYAGRGAGAGLKHSSEIYVFDMDIANLYDSFALFDDDVQDTYNFHGDPPEIVGPPPKVRSTFPPASSLPRYFYS